MPNQLKLSIGQYSDKGRKAINQDFHGYYQPQEPLLTTKGIAIALADGISTSEVSHIASETAIKSFFDDYFCTSETWSVKKSALQVLAATNSWLYSQGQKSTQRFNKDKGYVCTFSALIIKSTSAHFFHIGDARIYRLTHSHSLKEGSFQDSTSHDNASQKNTSHEDSSPKNSLQQDASLDPSSKKNSSAQCLEQLTHDHRLWVSDDISYLSRALGVNAHADISYDAFNLTEGDIYILLTDGVYEKLNSDQIISIIKQHSADLNKAAQTLVEQAFALGSDDNLTAQILRVDELASAKTQDVFQPLMELPFPPILDARMQFDGYTILRKLYTSSRSHVYLAQDNHAQSNTFQPTNNTNTTQVKSDLVVLKALSIDLQSDSAHVERFLMEEWIARRINSPHVLKPYAVNRQRNFLYTTTEYIEGQTLAQWMLDNPRPSIQIVRDIIEQIAKGLQAFHRLEMLHQDLRPANIMIDLHGQIKIIDFGSTHVAGLMEITDMHSTEDLLGTMQYTAPEYFLGEAGSSRSDIFSLAVICYQMLSGKLPYGTKVSQARSKSAQYKLRYRSVLHDDLEIPAWIDDVLEKALEPNPYRRYAELSEFIHDLGKPSRRFLNKSKAPLIERHPVAFWQGTSFILFCLVIFLLAR